MKVIDLLNRIANGEEVPIFEYEGRRYKYNKKWLWFDDIDDNTKCKNEFYCCELNDKIKIIEDTPKEKKKIEKLSDELKYPKLCDSTLFRKNIVDKINKIIDRLNGDSDE